MRDRWIAEYEVVVDLDPVRAAHHAEAIADLGCLIARLERRNADLTGAGSQRGAKTAGSDLPKSRPPTLEATRASERRSVGTPSMAGAPWFC
jgi:hypothetical protein